MRETMLTSILLSFLIILNCSQKNNKKNPSRASQKNSAKKIKVVKRKSPLDHLKDGQEVKIKGVFKIVGNEPFTEVAFVTKEKHYYYIPRKIDKKYRSTKHQGKQFMVHGKIRRQILRTPNGIEILKVYLIPLKVIPN